MAVVLLVIRSVSTLINLYILLLIKYCLNVQWKKDLLPDEGLEDCCNVHDHCYDECGADKDICDLEFKTCLYSVCKSRKHEWTVNELKGM